MDLPRVEAEGGVVIPKSRPVLKRNREVRQRTCALPCFFPLTVRYLPQVGQVAGDDVGCSFLECRVCPSPRDPKINPNVRFIFGSLIFAMHVGARAAAQKGR